MAGKLHDNSSNKCASKLHCHISNRKTQYPNEKHIQTMAWFTISPVKTHFHRICWFQISDFNHFNCEYFNVSSLFFAAMKCDDDAGGKWYLSRKMHVIKLYEWHFFLAFQRFLLYCSIKDSLSFSTKLIDNTLEVDQGIFSAWISGESKASSAYCSRFLCHCQVINIFLAFMKWKRTKCRKIYAAATLSMHFQSANARFINDQQRKMRRMSVCEHFVGVIVWNNCLKTDKIREHEVKQKKWKANVFDYLDAVCSLNKFNFFIEFYNFWRNYEFIFRPTQYTVIKFKARTISCTPIFIKIERIKPNEM